MSRTAEEKLAPGHWRIRRAIHVDGREYSFQLECVNRAYGLRKCDEWENQITDGRAPQPRQEQNA
jgi:hypothetical protein